ncbi:MULTISPECIES: HpcH/HpaI aldolase/citrate lyase family protein [Achromobacter]|uniref:CoA ester lyase n=1 Tax=Achromobacter spanius TaxID=217203 RepID=A0ABY8GV09_9BURK|nr:MULTISPECIES: CoA ester lyase [Achromobacter]WAI82054.1 CoA ester lyase [Achromobacter spanius]WEX92142.1 CoA ester lyase [Achromobacter sp. SS2-2022]WFP08711.1 CoA ester lyase [Achromobacter spanius]
MLLSEARSLLFVPATSPHLWAKAAQRGADAIVIDLEDAVPLHRKSEARDLARKAIEQLVGQTPILVRVNASEDLLPFDLEALPLSRLQGVLLPKVESAAQVQALATRLADRQEAGTPSLPIAALIESPLGVLQAQSIATAHPTVGALGFGAEDYAVEMGVSPEPQSLMWPAQAIACCARAYRLACWGLPGSVAEIQDMTAFAQLVQLARAAGFSGTVCVHPRQVAVANEGFGPNEQELAWARRVLLADEEAAAKGQGVAMLDGRMVDRPVIERARRWIVLQDR